MSGELLVTNGLGKDPPVPGLGGRVGVFGAFPAGGSSLGGSARREARGFSAWGVETRGARWRSFTMAAACSASGLWWEEKSAPGLSGGMVSLPFMSRPRPSLPWGWQRVWVSLRASMWTWV